MRIVCRINKITNTHSCNTYCFSTAKMVTRTGLSVTLYVHYLSRFREGCLSGMTSLQINFGHNILVCVL